MPEHVFEETVCLQVGLCQSTHVGVGDQGSMVEQGLWSAPGGGGLRC